jgi:uncharacterized protein (TIGR02147 family)
MNYTFVSEHREYLKREFISRLNRRPLYSKRAYARDLGLSPSTLTDYLNDKMSFSMGRIVQLGKKIGLSESQSEHWYDLVVIRFSKDAAKIRTAKSKLKNRIDSSVGSISLNDFKFISEWEHIAFLELIDMDTKKYSNLKNSAKALGISYPKMLKVVRCLMELKLLKKDEATENYIVDPNTQIGNTQPSKALLDFHRTILDKAKHALDHQSMDKRFVSSTFVGIPESQVAQVIKQLESAAYTILSPYIKTEDFIKKDKLYCLGINFFDLLDFPKNKGETSEFKQITY